MKRSEKQDLEWRRYLKYMYQKGLTIRIYKESYKLKT
jgi:hypothetical protein